ncbi:MAG: hypothetical protein MR992_14690 [Lachnospiraceae bacterium]|nr:hypothetical protein [Lachnospiraceae bacterium]
MASKADEIIQLRNEGMAYALKIAKEGGLEELERQVKLRGLLKVSVKFTQDELYQSIQNISERVYNNTLTIWYAVFHDKLNYKQKRLQRLKQWFDEKVYLVGEQSPMGHKWATFIDYGEEANRLYNLGIDLEKLKETQEINEQDEVKKVYADEVVRWLDTNGFHDASEAVRKEIYGE